MPANALFSSYRTGENRVTGSMLAVFERVGIDVLQRILGGAMGDSDEVELVSFRSQPAEVPRSVPDAAISSSFRYLFEVKTVPNDPLGDPPGDQVGRHLAGLEASPIRYQDERVVVITPDAGRPDGLAAFPKDRVWWIPFADLHKSIGTVLDQDEPIAPDSIFLLRELRSLFRTEGLVDAADTVIVAAAKAYPAYQHASAYVCQPGRSFRKGLSHLGFYFAGEVKPLVPRILMPPRDRVVFSRANAARLRGSDESDDTRIADIIDAFLDIPDEQDREDREWQVFVLSRPEDDQTISLANPIRNTATTRQGAPWAWTTGQPRYTRLAALERIAGDAENATTGALDKA